MNGTIHLAWLFDEGLVCYEGNHRLQALREEVEFVTVDILWNVTEVEIAREFKSINSAQSVSEYLIKDLPSEGKVRTRKEEDPITKYVNDTCLTYESLIGKSLGTQRPSRPRFVKDDLLDSVRRVCDKLKSHYTAERVLQALDYLNQAYISGEREIPNAVGVRNLDRARECGFMLYCTKKSSGKDVFSLSEVKWALEQLHY